MPQWLHILQGLSLLCSSVTVIHSSPSLLAYKYFNYIRTVDDVACVTSQLENLNKEEELIKIRNK